MQFAIKLLVSIAIIIFCSQIGRKFPTLAGLIATMPLTSLIVLLWLWTDKPGDTALMQTYTKGVLWGIIPTILFFIVAFVCFKKGIGFGTTIAASFAVWLLAAAVHKYLLGR